MVPEGGRASEVARFVANGLFATALHFGVLSFNMECVQMRSAGVANLIASVFGIGASFLGNRHFVFRATTPTLSAQAIRFLGLHGALALFGGLQMQLWAGVLGWDYRLGFLFVVCVQMILAYLGNRHLVFRG